MQRPIMRPQGGGPQPFKPTKKMRESVQTMAGYGMPQVDIARLITEEGIDPKTLQGLICCSGMSPLAQIWKRSE